MILKLFFSPAAKRRRRQLTDNGDNVISFGPDIPGKEFLSELDLSVFIPSAEAPPGDECREENGPCNARMPYRTFSGHCNNLERPNLGKSLTTFARLLPSVYENSWYFSFC